jgi:flagellar hook assembly protein FlgD
LRFGWDGETDAGDYAPQGIYQVQAFSDVGGSRQALPVNMPDQVVSVSIGEAGVMANLSSGVSIAASQIQEIQ